jgi:guanylate kinase
MSSEFLLIALCSPSGAGKTTLTKTLLQHLGDLRFSVSHTTRPPRSNEADGKDYHFVDRATFEAEVARGAFLEWAHVHANLYGTSLAEIDRAQAAEGVGGIIFDIDYQGARQIRAKRDDLVSIFVLPPSMEELERRLRGRRSETEETFQRRFSAAKHEIEQYAFFDYVIVNDTLDRAADELRSIVVAERARRRRRASLAEGLLRSGYVTSDESVG